MTAAALEQPEKTNRPDGRDDKPRIVVVGSINMDLVVRAPVIPSPGETVMGHNSSTIPGGKGANQAIAASHCGGQVNLIGRVGNDDFGGRLLMGLKAHGVNTAGVSVSEGISTGTAMIMVDDNGENSICVAGGANHLLSIEDIDDQLEIFSRADLVLMQMEIPYETILYTIELARRYEIPVILNPAPAPTSDAMRDAPLNPGLFEVDILVPNEHEISKISPVSSGSGDDVYTAKMASLALIGRGVRTIITTLGHRGTLVVTEDQQSFRLPAFKTKIVDTTGAGDAFCGALAVAYTLDKDLRQATRFAAAAGALACSRFGAQPSMPRLEAITTLLRRSC